MKTEGLKIKGGDEMREYKIEVKKKREGEGDPRYEKTSSSNGDRSFFLNHFISDTRTSMKVQ